MKTLAQVKADNNSDIRQQVEKDSVSQITVADRLDAVAQFASDYADVKDLSIPIDMLGGKGDNATFNDAAFAQALTLSRSTGIKKIKFGNGIYKFRNTVLLTLQDRSLVVEGSGKSRRTSSDVQMGTCIYFVPDADNVMFMIGPQDSNPEGAPLYNGVQGITFKNLCILTDGSSNIVTWPAAKYRPGSIAIEDNRGGEVHVENVWVQGFDKGLRLINSDFTRTTNYSALYCNVGMYLGPRSDQTSHIGCDFTFCNTALIIAGASAPSFITPNFVMCGTTTSAMVEIKQGDSNNNVNGVSFICPWFEVDAATLVANAGNIDLFGFLDIGNELTGNGFVDGLSIISPAGTHSYNAAFGNVNRFARVQKARTISIVACRTLPFKTTGLDLQGTFSPEISIGGYAMASTRSAGNLGVVTTQSNVNTYRTTTGNQKFLNVSGITSPVIPYSTLDPRHGTVFESGNNDTGIWIAATNSARVYFGAPAASNTAGLAKYIGFNHDTNNSVRIESNGKQAVFELQGLYLGNATRENNAPGAIGSLMAYPEMNIAPTSAPVAGGCTYFKNGKFTIMGTDGRAKVPIGALASTGIVEYADNAAAIAGGLQIGEAYRTGDVLKIVH